MGTDIGILKLLADPAELGKRVAEYERAKAAADAAVALVGPAQEIPKLLADAEAAEREAANALAAAEARAAKIIEDARAQAQGIVAAANIEISKAKAEAEENRLAAERALAEATQLRGAEAAKIEAERAALMDRAQDIGNQRADLDIALEKAEEAHDAAQAELKRLKGIAERFRAVASEV